MQRFCLDKKIFDIYKMSNTLETYEVRIPAISLNKRYRLTRPELAGICVARAILFPDTPEYAISLYSVSTGLRHVKCSKATYQKHVLLDGEEAFEFDLSNSEIAIPKGHLLKVIDLPAVGSFIVSYSSEDFRRGFEQVFKWFDFAPEEYLRDLH